jgi:hypothetical protein
VEWIDQYAVSDETRKAASSSPARPEPRRALDFAVYHQRIRDLTPKWRRVPGRRNPFQGRVRRRGEIMIFNIADYGHTLLNDFFIAAASSGRRARMRPGRSPPLKEIRHQLHRVRRAALEGRDARSGRGRSLG